MYEKSQMVVLCARCDRCAEQSGRLSEEPQLLEVSENEAKERGKRSG